MNDIRNTRTLTIASLLAALGIVVGFFKIPVSNIVEIRFNAVPLAAAGSMFGPYVAGIVGMITDVGGYLVKPTGPYFPGFTLSAAITGVIFGAFLHKKRSGKAAFYRITSAVLLNTVVVNLILNSLWLTIMYGNGGFIAVLTARLLKEIVMIPINIILIAAISKPIDLFLRNYSKKD